ncbi:MAG TPA: TonB-dependent receptor, partial [Vicinamibacteria bacterium]|nr:TonB-dependent receptor [Vicinamibacteria bacterium]
IEEDNVVLFRPGGAFAATASDPAVPVSQTLAYAGIDHRFSDAHSLRTKVMYERYRQQNFRVGGVADLTAGMDLDRDNFNLTGTHVWSLGGGAVNQLSVQLGRRKFDEPNNSGALAEYFSSGNTLQTGANITGDQTDTGTVFEVRETYTRRLGSGRWAVDLKLGGAWQHVKDEWNFPVYPQDLMIYVTDTRALPLLFVDASGSGASTITTDLLSGFVQADLRPASHLTLQLGLRYDLDTQGNNPDFTSPLQPDGRGRDANNLQPRAGLSWDVTGQGRHVLRGGVGVFTGRFLLVPSHVELQQNGFTGRIIQQRLNGAVIGVPALALNPANPTATGVPLPRDATRLDSTLVNPHTVQATVGYTARLGGSGLYADIEGIYVRGEDEVIIRDLNWSGNATRTRPNRTFNQINTYTNEGRSRYRALVASLRGTIAGGHIVTASYTLADKKNINDDFSPALTDYPNDPAAIEAEYGRSRADERHRFVASGVFNLPWRFQVAPVFEYGSGQPWNHRLGYDFNGDGKNSDRPADVPRFNEEGPDFVSVNLRLMHRLPVGKADLTLIAEVFNLLNRDNNDVNSIFNGE